ncbi:MAG TPA: hypothetical protein VMD09_02060 [Solirubrobacteraceae bacterium]|nr:hypothetical protein [Solirubrobacteraceae bacterium]
MVVAGIAGILITTPAGPRILASVAAGLAVVTLVRRFGSGVLVGLLLLGGVDALPGPNLEKAHIAFTITAQDLVVFLLVATLVWYNGRDRFRGVTARGWPRAAVWWSALFLALWLVTVIRTVLTSPVPFIHAMFIARDFAYFALLLPLLVGPLRRASDRTALLATCAIGGVVASLAQIAAAVSGSGLTLLVHPVNTLTYSSIVRIYTGAAVLPVAMLPLGMGLALLGASRRARAAGLLLSVVGAAAIAVSLTRAEYVGEVAGLGLAFALWLAVGDTQARVGRRRAIRGLAGVGVIVALLVLYKPPVAANNAVSGVTARITSTVTDLANPTTQGNTLEIRAGEEQDLEYVLRGNWLFGLGFLDPTYDYIPYVPLGSIRNSDTGYFNTLMTIGVFGTVLYCLPLLAVPLGMVRRRLLERRRAVEGWIGFGVAAWSIAVLISSQDLVMLFSPTGVVSVSAVLALGIASLAGAFSPRRAADTWVSPATLT